MIGFGSSKVDTFQQLLSVLLAKSFDEEKANTLFKKGVDINQQNDEGETLLHLCVHKYCLESVRWLLTKNVNLEIEANEGLTPIFFTAEHPRPDILHLLIENGAQIDHCNVHNRTLLQEAVINNNKRITDILFPISKKINNVDVYGHNVIYDAIFNGDKEMISKVSQNKEVDLNQIDSSGNTILHQKTVRNNDTLAIDLMKKGADPTVRDSEGKNFLFHIASEGLEREVVLDEAIHLGCDIHQRSDCQMTILMDTLQTFLDADDIDEEKSKSIFEMVKKLIGEGVDINAQNNYGQTALFLAVEANNVEVSRFFVENTEIDLDLFNNMGNTVLGMAALKGIEFIEILTLLLHAGANPNVSTSYSETIFERLSDAILFLSGKKEILPSISDLLDEKTDYLLILRHIFASSNVNLNILNSKGKPLFFDSVLLSHDGLFKLMCRYDLNINLKDNEGRNILYNIMSFGECISDASKREVVTKLENMLCLNADVNSRDNFGGTVVHKSILDQCEHTTRVLIESKADLYAVDAKGRTLVHNCVWQSKIKHYKLLSTYDENIVNIPDNFGILPINYAAFMGHVELVSEMIDSGAHINNPSAKNLKMLAFLKKFYVTLDSLVQQVDNELDKKNVSLLVDNMKEEFSALNK